MEHVYTEKNHYLQSWKGLFACIIVLALSQKVKAFRDISELTQHQTLLFYQHSLG